MLDKIKFSAGNENKFFNFINNLNKNDKIALITHTDIDGIGAAKVITQIFDIKILKFLNYEELNKDLVKGLKKLKANKIIFADLSISNYNLIKEIEKFANILIIDHHTFEKNLNSNKTVFINAQGFCTSYICYYLFSKIKNLEKFDWLVACASIADWQFFSNPNFMNHVYKKYGYKFKMDPKEIKKGKFWKLQYNLYLALICFRSNIKKVYDLIGNNILISNSLKKYIRKVQDEIDFCIKRFDKEKELINDIYFWEVKSRFPIKSILVNKISSKNKNRIFIFGERKRGYYKISVIRQDKKINMVKLLKNLTKNFALSIGGHPYVSGAVILTKDIKKFKSNLINYK